MDYKKIKVGDKVKILSFPRIGDRADGFAGTVGTVEAVNYDEHFMYHQIGFIVLKLASGATFAGVGINRLRFEILT